MITNACMPALTCLVLVLLWHWASQAALTDPDKIRGLMLVWQSKVLHYQPE